MFNTILYAVLVCVSLYFSSTILQFFVLYFTFFLICEILDIAGFGIWSQKERTKNCYDWFEQYFKKDYGIVDGKPVFDYSENLYLDDYAATSEKALLNKYQYLFDELQLSKGKKLLDCGCGIGTWMQFCKDRGVEVVGLTLSKEQKTKLDEKGLTAHVQDYRVEDSSFIENFDAISLLGSSEHISEYSGMATALETSEKDYTSLFGVLKKYLKADGRVVLTVLVQCKPRSEWSLYDYFQAYVMQRHYGGYYTKTEVIERAVKVNGFEVDSLRDYTKDYHWISVAEPDHFGHWWVHWEEDPLNKIAYVAKGLFTDPFLLHHWLYYFLDTWMWQFSGYQNLPLTDKQVATSMANLKYFTLHKSTKLAAPLAQPLVP